MDDFLFRLDKPDLQEESKTTLHYNTRFKFPQVM